MNEVEQVGIFCVLYLLNDEALKMFGECHTGSPFYGTNVLNIVYYVNV